MGYEIIATSPGDGQLVASLETKIKHDAAHLLMGALGVYYDQDDENGPCDAYSFTRAEISAAQSALTLAGGVPDPPQVGPGLDFLREIEMWMHRNEEDSLEIGFF